jgi:NAD(P)-dependent dehydrogenase (short-subunit alcohol dehydrogenase family)
MPPQIPQTVVVSGSSGGIGTVLVHYFLNQNALVIGIDKNASVTPIDHPNYRFLQADLSDYADVVCVAKGVAQHAGALDLLVNCAGVFMEDSQTEEIPRRLSFLWSNNVASAIYLSYALHPFLNKATHPLVVMISSTDAVVASGGQDCEVGVGHDILYASTKGALLSFTRALAMKWSPKIRVNAICPTIVRTPMAGSLLAVQGKEKQLASYIPLKRVAEPEDVAEAVASLYALKMTTAHILPVDGGYLCQ